MEKSAIMQLKGIWETKEVFLDGKSLRPDESQKIINHSPDGFNWGYGGSGPSQLALAVCLEFLQPAIEQACKIYQAFKWEIIANLPQTDFDITINMGIFLSRKETV